MQAGASVSLAVETRITDETIQLYGFSSAEEREWFRLLQTVQSVGARVAIHILSALSPRELERAVALADKAAVGRAQGVGPKLAGRIVTELKDKAPGHDAARPGRARRGRGGPGSAARTRRRCGRSPGQARLRCRATPRRWWRARRAPWARARRSTR